MIFILAEELAAVQEWNLHDVSSIDRLAHSAFEGSHIVAIESPQVAQALLSAKDGTFGAVTTAVLKKILANFTFQGGLLSHGLICATVTTVPSAAVVAKRADRVLTLDDIRGMSLEPTTNLAENVTDAKVYEIAAKHFIANERLRGLCVAACVRGGGGSEIYPELQEIVAQARQVCLALTDSDARWPDCGQSNTARKCEQLIRDAQIPTGHSGIPVRELENLIPTKILLEIVDGNDILDSVKKLERLIGLVPEVRCCGDLKDGVNGVRVFQLREGSPERTFLSFLLAQNHPGQNCCEQSSDCVKERNGAECSCVAIPKVGNVASRFHDWLVNRSSHKALESFCPPWRDAWLSVGATTFAWCCAQPRIRG